MYKFESTNNSIGNWNEDKHRIFTGGLGYIPGSTKTRLQTQKGNFYSIIYCVLIDITF